MSEGWFKVHRCLFEKAIWQQSTPEQKVILITLLSMANHKGREWEWKGKQFKAEPGMLVTSIESISLRCGKGISIQNIRSALKKFAKYEFLTEEVTKTGRLITILNWGLYQGSISTTNKETNKEVTDDQQSTNKEVTDNQQTGNKELTPNKNDKNNKNANKDKKEENEEEEKPTPPTLSFPSPYHQKIFNHLGKNIYRAWFEKSVINESKEGLVIEVNTEFSSNTIKNRYKLDAETAVGKKISVKVAEENE